MDAKQNNAASSSENRMGHPAACPDDRKKIIFDRNDGIFALITLVLGYLFLRFVSLVDPGAGIPLFTLCYLLGYPGICAPPITSLHGAVWDGEFFSSPFPCSFFGGCRRC